MSKILFVTGNQHKADYFARLAGVNIGHHGVDQPEIQSLDLRDVTLQKAKTAYALLGHPVVVEDTSFTIASMGKLPGTFIKWFMDEMGAEKICRLADISSDRTAVAACMYVYYDGKKPVVFEGSLQGTVPQHPKGGTGFGWNPIFTPDGQALTLGEMTNDVFEHYYLQIKPIKQIGEFLRSLS